MPRAAHRSPSASPKPGRAARDHGDVGHQLSSGVGEVHVEPGELRRRDPPLAVDLLVGLVVVAVAVEPHAVRPDRRGPAAPRSRSPSSVRRQLDLGHVPVVDGDRVGERLAEERHELVGAGDHATAGLGRVHHDVVGEDLAHPVPVLGVHGAEVPRLELPDRFEVVHGPAFWVDGSSSTITAPCPHLAVRRRPRFPRAARQIPYLVGSRRMESPKKRRVGVPGFEPGASASRTLRANQAAPHPVWSRAV